MSLAQSFKAGDPCEAPPSVVAYWGLSERQEPNLPIPFSLEATLCNQHQFINRRANRSTLAHLENAGQEPHVRSLGAALRACLGLQ